MKRWIFILLGFLTQFTYSQDSIIGIYGDYFSDTFISSQDVFYNNGKYQKSITCCMPAEFYGKWIRINETTVIVKIDSIVGAGFELWKKEKNLEFKFELSNDTLIQTNNYCDKCFEHWRYLRKRIAFYPNDSIKYEIKKVFDYYCKTTYYPNGRINEIVEYKNNKKHGVYFKYNENGILIIQELWKKGKRKKRIIQYYDNGMINWNKTIIK